MMTFDASSRDLCSVKRQETNTPLQALVLLNDPQLIEASRVLASKIMKAYGSNIEKQIEQIFVQATSRKPSPEELALLKVQYDVMLEKIARKEIIPSEYLTIGATPLAEDIPKEALTALALTAHTILNLDETITRG